MAATNYTPISLYYSTTASSAPTAGNLVNGELAINITDGKLYYKDNGGVVQTIASKAGNVNVSSFSAGTTGLTPNTATTGAVTLAGTLVVANGGTGQTSFTSGYVLYGNGTGGLSSSANMTFNGTKLTLANDASISGLTVGKGAGADSGSTVVGSGALAGSNIGANNSAVGRLALAGNTSGAQNNAFGYAALTTNTTGADNTAVGHLSLTSNTTGGQNVAVGRQALQANTTASNNSAFGELALYSNTTASNNTAVGYQAGYSNTTGTPLTAVGALALYSNTTGAENAAFGLWSLKLNSTGNYNTAVGDYALLSNTTASNNTAVGYQAGYSNTTGQQIACFGYQAGYSSTSDSSTYIGSYAGQGTTGTQNTFLGQGSGYLVTTGAKNTIIGRYSGNQGGLDIRTSNNYIVLSDGDGNPRQIIDSSGNLGLGVTPSAWGSNWRAINFGYSSGIGQLAATSAGSGEVAVVSSAYNNNTNWLYFYTGAPASKYSQVSGQHQWFTAASGTAGNTITFTQAMTLDASGNLGIGTTSPSYKLDVFRGVTNGAVAQFTGNNTGRGLKISTAQTSFADDTVVLDAQMSTYGTLQFSTGGTTRATIDSSGNVGIGTSSPTAKLDVRSSIVSRDTATASTTANSFYYGGAYTGNLFTLINGYSPSGTNQLSLGGGVSSAEPASLITFYTGSAGTTSSGTERMRIDSSGNLLVGTTSANATSVGARIITSTTIPQISVGVSATSNNYLLYNTTAGAYRFFVSDAGQINATSTSITAISDSSLKENIRDLETGLTEVMALKPRRFDWKEETKLTEKNVAGFIAQEVEQVLPELVYDYKYNEEQTKKSLKMGDILPTLVKAIQEQQALIDSLTTRLAALEAK